MRSKSLIWILWPSFVVAGVAEGAFFSVFDPLDLYVFGGPHEWSRLAVYSTGFLAFWILCAASSALTFYLQRSPSEKRS